MTLLHELGLLVHWVWWGTPLEVSLSEFSAQSDIGLKNGAYNIRHSPVGVTK